MAAYNDDPSLRDVPIHLSELEEFAHDPRPVVRDARKLSHLLGRAVATVVNQKNQIRQLQTDVNAIRFSSERMGAATTLSPRDAVRYLSPAELEQVVKGTHQHVLAQANRAKVQAEEQLKAAVSAQARVRLAVLDIVEDVSVPADVRQRLADAFAEAVPSHGSAGAAVSGKESTGGVDSQMGAVVFPNPAGAGSGVSHGG